MEDYHRTNLGQQFAKLESEHPGESGFSIVRYGNNAFNLRLSMIDLAEETIDLQVYIWTRDDTGIIMAERILQAARRGVRVRLLVDDLGFGGEDMGLSTFNSHPNIEIRVFNPFANRNNRVLDFVFDLGRVNHRMHNKTLIADNSVALVGGRNIGDIYFGVGADTNFRDLDIFAVGPIVRDISSMFDHFWRSEHAVPVEALLPEPPSDEDIGQNVTSLYAQISQSDYPYDLESDVSEYKKLLQTRGDALIWAPGAIIWDDPDNLSQAADRGGEVATRFRNKLSKIDQSLVIESAYFVVGDGGVDKVKELSEKGVEVRVLTNSLLSNDVLAAHAGHANYRQGLVEAGAEIYEFRADSTAIRKTWVGDSKAGLHTKAMAFDGRSLFIGSFNLDPRSANINTEAGVYVESPILTAQLLEYMDEGVQPENAYRLSLDENGKLIWTTQDKGDVLRYNKDPLSTWGQRFTAGFIGILPIESQL
ncbi:MAG: phospholipase D family protein [Pseudomonadota bacterium]